MLLLPIILFLFLLLGKKKSSQKKAEPTEPETGGEEDMGSGLEVNHGDGKVLIDSEYKMLELEDSGDLQITFMIEPEEDSLLGVGMGMELASERYDPPLLALRPNTSTFVNPHGGIYRKTNGKFSHVVYYAGKSDQPYGGVTLDMDYGQGEWIEYALYRPLEQPLNPSGYGLEVWGPEGELVFHSDRKYLKIREVHDISIDDASQEVVEYNGSMPICEITYPYVDISHPDVDHAFYFLQAYKDILFRGNNYDVYGWYIVSKLGVKRLTDTSVRVGWFQSHGLSFGGLGYNPYPSVESNNMFPGLPVRLFVCSL